MTPREQIDLATLPELRRLVEVQASGPWIVGEKPQERSMWPIRSSSGKVVAYAYSYAVARLIAVELGDAR